MAEPGQADPGSVCPGSPPPLARTRSTPIPAGGMTCPAGILLRSRAMVEEFCPACMALGQPVARTARADEGKEGDEHRQCCGKDLRSAPFASRSPPLRKFTVLSVRSAAVTSAAGPGGQCPPYKQACPPISSSSLEFTLVSGATST